MPAVIIAAATLTADENADKLRGEFVGMVALPSYTEDTDGISAGVQV